MKMLVSIIRPEKLPEVKKSLYGEGIRMMTVYDVKGCGQQMGFIEGFRGILEEVTLHRKVMLLISVNDSYVEKAIRAIIRGARTNGGSVGDGKIFVLPLEDAIRIRTGESGVAGIGGDSPEIRKLGKRKVILKT